MKKFFQRVAKYIIIFFITLLILVAFLTATSKIPREAIVENIKNSEKSFNIRAEVYEGILGRDYTARHMYADGIALNMIYCIDTDKPLASTLQAKYYAPKKDESIRYINYEFTNMIDEKVEGNVQYLRYWHGYMGIMRIMLLFFDIGGMYTFSKVVLAILAIILAIMLIRKKAFILTIALVVASIMGYVATVPTCLEYTWVFYIMLITSILAVKFKDNKEKLNILFFITGMVTCFFDFLTTEILTIGVPVIIVLMLNVKDKKITNIKQGLWFVFKSCLLWGISYAAMWGAKWILASIVLKINALEYVLEEAKLRINGDTQAYGEIKNLYLEALSSNILTLYPIALIKKVKNAILIPIILVIVETIIIRKKDMKKLWLSGLLVMIALIPYVRYLVLANHSYLHYFFTFRDQIITVTALILAMICSMNIEFIENQVQKIKQKIKNILKKKTTEKDSL